MEQDQIWPETHGEEVVDNAFAKVSNSCSTSERAERSRLIRYGNWVRLSFVVVRWRVADWNLAVDTVSSLVNAVDLPRPLLLLRLPRPLLLLRPPPPLRHHRHRHRILLVSLSIYDIYLSTRTRTSVERVKGYLSISYSILHFRKRQTKSPKQRKVERR